ncbi:hypothetical protein KJ855_00175 [Patescibacteria group bacterium]|nr:hypothetical protein [Patescibacteria group bacterium]
MENKVCKQCSADFVVEDEDLEFYKKMAPTFAGQTFDIPSPTKCPDCRQQHRLCFRTETNISKSKCALSGKEVLSMYSPQTPYAVADYDEWIGDKWDPLSYGRDFDFGRPFFEQFYEMAVKVPIPVKAAIDNENCDFLMAGAHSKDCYMGYALINSEECMYGNWMKYCRDCIDCFQLWECELCYEIIDGQNCYECSYCQGIRNCRESMLMRDCQGCNNCFGCVNLNGKQYWIFNKAASKEEYEKIVEEFKYGPIERKKELRNKYLELVASTPRRYAKIFNAENSSGDYINNCKNVKNSFFVEESENIKYANNFTEGRDSQDSMNSGYNSERIYMSVASGADSQNLMFDLFVFDNVGNVHYSVNCNKGVSDCFACVSLKKKQYCVFNKQYTKEEYEELVARIIKHMQKTGEWGEFFPVKMSPWAYNESKAQLFFPLKKEEVHEYGAWWRDEKPVTDYQGEFVEPKDIRQYNPTHNSDAQIEIDNLLKGGAIECVVTGRPFRVTSKELSFYIKQGIPIPREHPENRIYRKLKLISFCRLFKRQCDCSDDGHGHAGRCEVNFETTYAPSSKEKVYCESCYQKSVI